MNNPDSDSSIFLGSSLRSHWEKIGVSKRAGVCTPLFSIYSTNSVGIGEIPDLKLLIDWCTSTGLSILQLLPLNDMGWNFLPYDAQSPFALDDIYLSIEKLEGIEAKAWHKDIEFLKQKYPCTDFRVNYHLKREKRVLLRKIFESQKDFPPQFTQFRKSQEFWLIDHALFRCLQEQYGQASWENWDKSFREHHSETLLEWKQTHRNEVLFYEWLQWQLYRQMKQVKEYADQKGVFLMGDMPYLVSRNSDYVWAYQRHFKLHLESGAPPDLENPKGQRWGMPPYDWKTLSEEQYGLICSRLAYAGNFYHLYRIDHIVGIFRVWTIHRDTPQEHEGSVGEFDPADEVVWEEHGRSLLKVMLESTSMLPCGEDLGTIPACAPKVMRELGMPGLQVQRWMKTWDIHADFLTPSQYHLNAVSVLATHDTSSFLSWWLYECGTVSESVFLRWCEIYHIHYPEVMNLLFDPSRSTQGRLAWNKDVHSEEDFLRILGRRAEEVPILVGVFRRRRLLEIIVGFAGKNASRRGSL